MIKAPAVEVRNGILAALLATEYRRLAPKLEHVTLKAGDIVYSADQEIEAVYFPEEAVVAMVDAAEDGRTVEVGIVGREGIVGINPGRHRHPRQGDRPASGRGDEDEVERLAQGDAFRQPAAAAASRLHAKLSCGDQPVGGLSQHHSVEQRLARWLLTMNDYARSGEFVMVHESVAAMLGVRRVGITEAAQRLRSAALIGYRRGRISVLDKAGLEKKSCECYRFIRKPYKALHAELPRLLSRK